MKVEDHNELVLPLIFLLELALHRSPYNYDIKIRLCRLNEFVNLNERSLELIKQLDIKSVQHETLGFLYNRLLLGSVGLNEILEFHSGGVQYFYEVYRETKEVILYRGKTHAYIILYIDCRVLLQAPELLESARILRVRQPLREVLRKANLLLHNSKRTYTLGRPQT